MTDGPTLESFQRHLQVALREADRVTDSEERRTRQWIIEGALQEAILFTAEYDDRVKAGVTPTQEVEARAVRLISTKERRATEATGRAGAETGRTSAASPGHSPEVAADTCRSCQAPLDEDVDFCVACGTWQRK